MHDPMYTDAELQALGWSRALAASRVDVAERPGRPHPQYAQLTADLPGLHVLLDGRRVTDPARFTGVPRLTIGGGEST